MSRIGKLPIQIPSGVTITVDSDVITVKGAKGELTVPHLSDVTVTVEDGVATVTRKDDEKIAKAQHGLQRALLKTPWRVSLKASKRSLKSTVSVSALRRRQRARHEPWLFTPSEVQSTSRRQHHQRKDDDHRVLVSTSNKSDKSPQKSAHSRNLSHTRVRVLSMPTK